MLQRRVRVCSLRTTGSAASAAMSTGLAGPLVTFATDLNSLWRRSGQDWAAGLMSGELWNIRIDKRVTKSSMIVAGRRKKGRGIFH